MIPHHTKAMTAGIMMFILFLTEGLPAHSQVTGERGGRGRRIGGVVLPTAPFNPDAGILNAPKARRASTSKVVSRRPNSNKAKISNRHPRPGTPRKRRVRRGRQLR